MALVEYRYMTTDFINGIPLLVVNPPAWSVASDSTSSAGVFVADASSMTAFGCNPGYMLLAKLFVKDVQTDRTGDFRVTVTGSMGQAMAQRTDTENFTMTWWITKGWDSIGSMDATVSVQPLLPMTSVSFNCMLSIGLDTIDRVSEG